jgi:hypothetical protein
MDFSCKNRDGYATYVVLASHPITSITDDLFILFACLSLDDWVSLIPDYPYEDERSARYAKVTSFYEQMAAQGSYVYFAAFSYDDALEDRSQLSPSQEYAIPERFLFPDPTETSESSVSSPTSLPPTPTSSQDSTGFKDILLILGLIIGVIGVGALGLAYLNATEDFISVSREERNTREQLDLGRQQQRSLREQSTIPVNPFPEDSTNLPIIFSTFPQLYLETQHEILEFCINKMGDISPEATSGPLQQSQYDAIAQGSLVLSYKEGALFVYRNGGNYKIRSRVGLSILTQLENETVLVFLFNVLNNEDQVALAREVRLRFNETFS